jgi:hypothetical protein
MAKNIAISDRSAAEAARKAAEKADTLYQFAVCFGLALMAGFVGTAGAFVVHTAI